MDSRSFEYFFFHLENIFQLWVCAFFPLHCYPLSPLLSIVSIGDTSENQSISTSGYLKNRYAHYVRRTVIMICRTPHFDFCLTDYQLNTDFFSKFPDFYHTITLSMLSQKGKKYPVVTF